MKLVSLGLGGRYSSVTKFDLPSEGYLEEPVNFELAGHLDESVVGWPNFALGLYYEDGPMDELTVILNGKSHTLKKGMVLAIYTFSKDACTTLDARVSIKFTVKGVYSFSGLTGYIDVYRGGFFYDDKVDKTIEISEKPVVPGWPEWLPWWVLPLAGGVAAVAIVAGVVAYQERERLMMLALLRRK